MFSIFSDTDYLKNTPYGSNSTETDSNMYSYTFTEPVILKYEEKIQELENELDKMRNVLKKLAPEEFI